jgi:DNA-binding transcriptional MerR regulator
MTERLFTQTEALEIAGIRTLTFQNWLKRGIFEASAKSDSRHRRYTASDVVRLAAIYGLTLHGEQLESAAEVASQITKAPNWKACLDQAHTTSRLLVFVRRPASKYLSGLSATAYAGERFSEVKTFLEQTVCTATLTEVIETCLPAIGINLP